MPTDIAPSITPTFDEVCPVADDGDYANHAALANMVRPALNRTEYLRQKLETAPWVEGLIFDDFTIPLTQITGTFYLADTLWQSVVLTDWTASGLGDPDAIGVMRLANSSANATEALFRKTLGLCSFGALKRCTTRVRTGNIASGNNFEVGLSASTDATVGETSIPRHVVSVVFSPALSPNWQLRTHDGTTEHYGDTGVVVAANTWYELDVTFDGSSYWLSVDGDEPLEAAADLPSAGQGCTLIVRYATPDAGANRRWDTDFVRLLLDAPTRVV